MPFGLGGKSETLTILLKGKDEFSKVFGNADKKLGGLKSSLKKVGIGAGIAGAAITAMAIGIGVKAVNAAMKFETAMGNIATLVDTSTESMSAMKEEVLDLAENAPVKIEDLTSALYQVRSAGIDSSEAMNVLRSSMQLGVAGLGTTEEATDLLTTAFNNFAEQGYTADEIANILFKTVKAGKTTVAQLAVAFGQVAPIAKAAGVSFEEMQAATAALTTVTGKTAESQTKLRALFDEMTRSEGKLAKATKDLGIENITTLIRSEGLAGALNKLYIGVDKNDTAFKNLFSSTEAAQAALLLQTDASESYNDTLTDNLDGVDELTIAYQKQKDIFDKTWAAVELKMNVALLKLGDKLLPSVGRAIDEIVLPALEDISDWVELHGDDISNFFDKIVSAIKILKTEGMEGIEEKIRENIPGIGTFDKLLDIAKKLPIGIGLPTMGLPGSPNLLDLPVKKLFSSDEGAGARTLIFNFSGTFLGDEKGLTRILLDVINKETTLDFEGR